MIRAFSDKVRSVFVSKESGGLKGQKPSTFSSDKTLSDIWSSIYLSVQLVSFVQVFFVYPLVYPHLSLSILIRVLKVNYINSMPRSKSTRSVVPSSRCVGPSSSM